MSSSNSKNLKTSVTGSKSKTGATTTVPTSPEGESNAVNIPIIRSKDNAKQLPFYTSAMQRSTDDYLAAEDLDNVQLELEKLLSNVAQRYRVLKSEYESLDKDERRNERRLKHANSSGADKAPCSPASAVVSSNKRKRDESSTVRKPKHTPSQLKHSKHSKNSPVTLHTDDSMDSMPSGTQGGFHGRDNHLQKPIVQKNDTPNKFWLSVEPYCMPLTNEDLRLLDDLLDQYIGPLVPPVPDLGPHYSTIWATEDLKEIQQMSNANPNANRLKQQNNSASAMLKKADPIIDSCVTGPLTQRLVSALMEEQLIQNTNDLGLPDISNSSSENTHSSSQLNFRSLPMLRNCIGIEKRLKKELIEQGLLDETDFPNSDEDEIQTEINRLVTELSAIAEYNSKELKCLREAATEEIKRLEVKRKLDTIDQELLETYKRTLQNKAKRKLLTPEEKQNIFRLTTEQKTLSDQLESMQSNKFTYE